MKVGYIFSLTRRSRKSLSKHIQERILEGTRYHGEGKNRIKEMQLRIHNTGKKMRKMRFGRGKNGKIQHNFVIGERRNIKKPREIYFPDEMSNSVKSIK